MAQQTETSKQAEESSDGSKSMRTHGPHPPNQDALRRLRNIGGQIAGIQRMVEEERYCIDILTQISAVRAALNSVGMSVLRRHLDHCVTDAMRSDEKSGQQVIDEMMSVLARVSI